MKKLIEFGVAALVLALSPALAEEGPGYGFVVYPERPVNVPLSNRDINRIVCAHGDVEDYKYSGEKGILVEATGSDAFVKFQIIEIGQERQYVTARSEFFVRCGGAMYTLFGEPRDIEAQTVFLGGAAVNKAKANEEIFNPLADEERAIAITHQILKETTGPGFSRVALDDPFRSGMTPGADVRRRSHYQIEGSGFQAAEFLVRASRDLRLDEIMFVRRVFGQSIYSVTIENPALRVGEITRVVVVYRGDGR